MFKPVNKRWERFNTGWRYHADGTVWVCRSPRARLYVRIYRDGHHVGTAKRMPDAKRFVEAAVGASKMHISEAVN